MNQITIRIDTFSGFLKDPLNVAETDRNDYYSFEILCINDQPSVNLGLSQKSFFETETCARFESLNSKLIQAKSRELINYNSNDAEIVGDLDYSVGFEFENDAEIVRNLTLYSVEFEANTNEEDEVEVETDNSNDAEFFGFFNLDLVEFEADTNEEGDSVLEFGEVTDDVLIDNQSGNTLSDKTKKNNFCSHFFWMHKLLRQVHFRLRKNALFLMNNECIAIGYKAFNSFFEKSESEFNQVICLGLKDNFCAQSLLAKKVNFQPTRTSTIKRFTRPTVDKNISVGCLP